MASADTLPTNQGEADHKLPFGEALVFDLDSLRVMDLLANNIDAANLSMASSHAAASGEP